MRNFLFCILSLITIFTCVANDDSHGNDSVDIIFNDTVIDLGNIKTTQGKITRNYYFTNIGDTKVTILGVLAQCGCTTPQYPQQPILPGENGIVRITYDTVGRPTGHFERKISLRTTGRRKLIHLYIKGNAHE